MKKLVSRMAQLWKDDEGATAVEYGIMVAAIAGVIIAVVISLGGHINDAFHKVDDNLPLQNNG